LLSTQKTFTGDFVSLFGFWQGPTVNRKLGVIVGFPPAIVVWFFFFLDSGLVFLVCFERGPPLLEPYPGRAFFRFFCLMSCLFSLRGHSFPHHLFFFSTVHPFSQDPVLPISDFSTGLHRLFLLGPCFPLFTLLSTPHSCFCLPTVGPVMFWLGCPVRLFGRRFPKPGLPRAYGPKTLVNSHR